MPIFALRRRHLTLAVCALTLSACTQNTPAPVGNNPSATPSSTSSPPPTTQPSPGTGNGTTTTQTAALTLRLQADAALAGFGTLQTGPFTLCLGQIASATTRVSFAGTLPDTSVAALRANGVTVESTDGRTHLSSSRALNLTQLLAGIELTLNLVPTGTIEGRTTFHNASGAELGFVSWEAQLQSGGGTVGVILKPASGDQPNRSCPRVEATVTGASFRGAGGNVVSGQPLPNPVTTPSPTPTTAPSVDAPGAPLNVTVVEQTSSSLVLQWDFHPDARSHKLYLDGALVAENHTNPNYYRFEGLRESTTYRLGVRSVNAGGESEIVTVTTATIGNGRSASGNFSGGGSGGGGGSSPSVRTGEFRANTETVNDQSESDIAMDEDGNFVIVWEDDSDGDETTEIHAQRFDAGGNKVGAEIEVTDQLFIDAFSYDYSDPAVAMDASGDFVVTWDLYGSYGQVNTIQAQRFTRGGQADGDPITVEPFASTQVSEPDVAMDDNGGFVVVWEENQNIGYSVYDANDNEVSDFIVPRSNSFFDFSDPAVAMDGDGDFVVVWHNYDTYENDDSLMVQGFTATGFTNLTQTTVTSAEVANPDVAMASEGDFVVVWQDDYDYELSGLRYTAGSPVDEFSIRVAPGSANVHEPVVAMDDDGDFVAVWSESAYGDSETVDTIMGQRFTSADQPDGEAFQINTNNDFIDLEDPAVAMNPDGAFAASWDNETNEEPEEDEVYARRFSAGSP